MIHLKREMVAQLDAPHGLRHGLQCAIELEHSTIPTYLYSLYSLGTSNAEIGQIILSVVQEEMLHFGLACNILNAIGGSPRIDKPDFIPKYPGPLPGGVESELKVHLRRFSLDHVKNTFMVIEEPEQPLHFPTAAEAAERVTIGQFYTKIADKLQEEGEGIFAHPHGKQVTGPFGLTAVTDLNSALQAITLIKEQGEGTTTSPLDPEGEFAHYYRFAEIYHGNRLRPVPNPPPGVPDDKKYRYDGPPVPFDPAGVLPVIDDPAASKYTSNMQAHYLNDNFNYAYTSALKVLHLTFNGEPERLESSIGLMHSLRELAMEMMTIPLDENTAKTAGPSFEYRPVNA